MVLIFLVLNRINLEWRYVVENAKISLRIENEENSLSGRIIEEIQSRKIAIYL